MTHSTSFEQYLQLAANNRSLLQRVFYSLVLMVLLFYAATHQLLFQLDGSPIFYQELDPTYWLFMALGAVNWLSSPAIILLDALLFLSCIGAIIWPGKTIFPWIFLLTHFTWFVLYNGSMGHHYAFYGILFLSFAFVFPGHRFGFALQFIRFAFCFIYGSAGMWKLFRGNLLYPPQTFSTLLSFNIEALIQPEHTTRTQLIQCLLTHPVQAHSLWIMVILLELVFLTGFITLRFDKLIGMAFLLFNLGGWYFFGVWNYENLLFLLTLFPALKWVGSISQKRPKIPE